MEVQFSHPSLPFLLQAEQVPALHRFHSSAPPPSSKLLYQALFCWQLLYWGSQAAQHSRSWSHKEGEVTTSLSLHNDPCFQAFTLCSCPQALFCKAAFYPAYLSTIWLQRCFGRFWHLACRGFTSEWMRSLTNLPKLQLLQFSSISLGSALQGKHQTKGPAKRHASGTTKFYPWMNFFSWRGGWSLLIVFHQWKLLY